jgi:predicted glutamine amidotransferase
MCGIFGAVKSSATNTNNFLELLLELGQLSEERGRHSAGLAFYDGKNVSVNKELVRFSRLKIANDLHKFGSSRAILGHTRFATQGSAHDIKNVSPMALEGLVGTHNGDVDKKSVPNAQIHQKAAQSRTDTEILYRELKAHVPGSKAFNEVLEATKGRLALAFISSSAANQLTLVRGAISPLAYAYTNDGTFVYASNPNWFRIVEARSERRITFNNISLLPEGAVISVGLDDATPRIVANFTPQCRETDLYFVNSSAYKNFTKGDKDSFNKLANRIIAPLEKPQAPLAPTVVEGYSDIAPQLSTYEPGMLFDDLFLAGKSTVPITESEDDVRISLEHVETLCGAFGEFDESIYELFLSCDSEEELEALYAEVIVEAFNVGKLTSDSFRRLSIPEPLGATIY